MSNDIINRRFGRLVVISYSNIEVKHHDKYVTCMCDCGNAHLVTVGNLKKGDVKSCGCLYKDVRLKDLSGQKFNRLTVLSDSGKRTASNRVVWSCECNCGNKTEVTTTNLTTNKVGSCGCLGKDTSVDSALELNDKYWREGTRLDVLKRGPQKNNTSGVKGVRYIKDRNRWLAYMVFKGERVLRKEFTKKEDAIRARKEAEQKYHEPIFKKYQTQ